MRAGQGMSGLAVCVVVLAIPAVRAESPATDGQGRRHTDGGADRYLVLYKVDDLLGQNDHEAPRLGVSIPEKGNSPIAALDREKRDERREKELRDLADVLRAAASAQDREVKIKRVSPPLRLAVTTTREGHGMIQRLIRHLTVDRQTQISVRLGVVPVDPELLKGLDEKGRLTVEKLMPRLRKGEKVELASALVDELIRQTAARYDGSYHLPRVTAFSGQLTHTLVINQAALVADLKVEERAGKKFAKPVIGVLNTGVVSEVRPTVVNDGKGVSLDVRFEFAEQTGTDVKLASEMEPYRDVEGADQIPLQFPQLNRVMLETSAVVPADRWVLLGSRPGTIRMYRKGEKPEKTASEAGAPAPFTLFFAKAQLGDARPAGAKR